MKHVRDTSLLAYQQIKPRLSDRYKMVMWTIRNYPNSTALELARHLGFQDPNKVRPRITELVDAGLVVSSGKRVDRFTGKLAYVWRLKKHEG